MKYNFDHPKDHKEDGSIRWLQPVGRTDVIGMGTADMDYECAPCIKSALSKVAEENIYHYKYKPENYYESVIRWFREKEDLEIKKEWMSNIPGTINAVCLALMYLSEPGDFVLMQSPYFNPLKNTIEGLGRRFLPNPLKLRDDRYEIDFDDFERKIREYHPSVFLLVNPQNPTGRVYTQSELERMTDICYENNVKIISDEVHFLITYDENRHIPILKVSERAREIAVQIFSFSKGFNMMSLPHGMVFIANEEMQSAWQEFLVPFNVSYASNSFAIAAVSAAAGGEADEWLSQVNEYLKGNRDYFISEISRRDLPLIPILPEAGYLLWIDCRNSGLDPERLSEIFLEKAGIALNNGLDHGKDGEGFIRINIAVSKNNLDKALNRIEKMFS